MADQMLSPNGHCLWLSNIHNCDEAPTLTILVQIQFYLMILLSIIGVVILVLNYIYFNQKLITKTDRGFQPNSIQCLLTFWTPVSILMAVHKFLILYDYAPSYAVRMTIESITWWLLSVGSTWYALGVIFTIPITFSYKYYQLNPKEIPTTTLLYLPSPAASRIILWFTFFEMLVICLPASVAAGFFLDRGDLATAQTFVIINHVFGSVMLFTCFLLSCYYGIKIHHIKRHYRNPSSKVSRGFRRLRNTFIMLAMYAGLSSPMWLLVITNYTTIHNQFLYWILVAWFRVGLTITMYAIFITLLVTLVQKFHSLNNSEILPN